MPDLNRRIIKWHPAYNTHAPITDWTDRPLILTYSFRNRNGLYIEPLGPKPAHPDLALLTVKMEGVSVTQIANVYSAPSGSTRANEGSQLLQHTLDATQPVLALGDFNLRPKH